MMRTTPALAAGMVAIALAVPPAVTPGAGADPSRGSTDRAQVVLDWERTAFTTVYPATPIPSGVPVLGFTSMAMNDAVRASRHRANSSEAAAVAVAAHDVLAHYYPAARTSLDAALADTLATVPDGSAQDTGEQLGAASAAAMIASRVGDGYGDPDVHYTRPPAIGTWQPAPPATDMLAPWLGSLRPLVLSRPVTVDGPDALTSADYAADFDEVKRLGSVGSTLRTQAQTDTAVFFNASSATMVSDAVVRYLETHPVGLRRTAQLFAAMHASMTDSVIRCWQLKRDVGFWRPSQAIAAAADDGNPATLPEPGWAPLIPNPPYSDYVSGHACLTGPAVEVVRRLLGERTTLELRSTTLPTAPRTYTRLADLERDAFNARIWSGLHFRDAMEDGYAIGHRTARRVLHSFD